MFGCCRIIERHRVIRAEGNERRIGIDRRRGKWVSSRKALPGIIEASRRARENHSVRPWRGNEAAEKITRVHVVRDSVRGANGHLSIPLWIPGKSEPRREILPLRVAARCDA